MVVTGVAASFSVNYEMLVTMRLLLGIFTAGARNAGFVYGEWGTGAAVCRDDMIPYSYLVALG